MKPVRQAVILVDDNKPKSEPVIEWPLIYTVIAMSTILFGIGSAIVYWKGW